MGIPVAASSSSAIASDPEDHHRPPQRQGEMKNQPRIVPSSTKGEHDSSTFSSSSSASCQKVYLRCILVSLLLVVIGMMTMCCGSVGTVGTASWLQVGDDNSSSSGSFFWNRIKPIKPLHHGTIWYSATRLKDNSVEYSRNFKIPCGHGLLVYNVGPAEDYQPFKYDVYEDGYVYDDNNGLCVFYPSYQAFQKGEAPFWEPQDPTRFTVKLGLSPQKISSRVVFPKKPKDIGDPIRGGDFAIIARHNFYTPYFYQSLKAMVNSWTFEDLDNPTTQEYIQFQMKTLLETTMTMTG